MADILPSKRKPAPQRSHLCDNGHHRWAIWQKKQFDTRRGKLVTVYRCERCNAERSEAH